MYRYNAYKYNRFLKLDIELNKLTEHLKNEVVNILAGYDNGKLCCIVDNTDISAEEWFEKFISKVNTENQIPAIAAALEKFSKFKLSVGEFLIYDVRDKLDKIDISLNTSTAKIESPLQNTDDIAIEIVELCKDSAEEIFRDIRDTITSLYSVPNRAMFAALKDLYDRITYSSDIDNEWVDLYEDWAQNVWTDEYILYMSTQSSVSDWNKIVLQAKDIVDQRDYFTVI